MSGRPRFPMNNCAYQIKQYTVLGILLWLTHCEEIRHSLSPFVILNDSLWCQHITSRSFNHFIEYGRWGAHIDSLSIHAIPTISSSRLFYVAPCARGTCDVTTVSSSAHTHRNLQFIHDRLDGYVPNHIFSTTLARIHRRQSFIFYASHAAEHNMTMKIFTTNGHRLLLRSPSAINFAPQGFSKFFPIFHDNFDFTHTPRGCLWHGISEHASCGIIFCGGVRNCIFGLLYSCHNVVAKQFQCVPFYQSQL